MGFKFGERSKKSLLKVHPFLISVAERAISISPLDFTIIEGARSIEDQKKYVAEGKSKTMNSKHLIQSDGFAHAFDAYPYYNKSVQVNAPIEKFKIIADIMLDSANYLKVDITRGYDWGWDAPHYELKSINKTESQSPGNIQKADFTISYELVKEYEGGYCNVAGDAGGETYSGIARNYFKDWSGWHIIDKEKNNINSNFGNDVKFSKHLDKMPDLQDLVKQWYKSEWWDKMNISQFDQLIANELFEQSINLGRTGSGKLIQTQLNAMNWYKNGSVHGGRLFNDLKVDGVLGPATLKAISIILDDRITSIDLVKGLNNMQRYHYTQKAAGSFEHRKFLDGWYKRT